MWAQFTCSGASVGMLTQRKRSNSVGERPSEPAEVMEWPESSSQREAPRYCVVLKPERTRVEQSDRTGDRAGSRRGARVGSGGFRSR